MVSCNQSQEPINDLPLDELRVLAEQGDAEAEFNLAMMCATSEGVAQDNAEAARWFRLAADQGHREAQFEVGTIYDFGHGVPVDRSETFRWYRLAADQGDAAAQFILGNMYSDGRGVPKDNVEAHMWFILASGQSTGEERETAVETRDAAAQRMTSGQIAESRRRAREWRAGTVR